MSERIAKSALHGAVVGLFYFVLALVFGVLRTGAVPELGGPAFASFAGLYLAGGAIIGAIAGWLQPSITSWGMAILIYAFAAFPVAVWANAVYYPATRAEGGDPAARIVMLSLFLGVLGGTAYWKNRREST